MATGGTDLPVTGGGSEELPDLNTESEYKDIPLELEDTVMLIRWRTDRGEIMWGGNGITEGDILSLIEQHTPTSPAHITILSDQLALVEFEIDTRVMAIGMLLEKVTFHKERFIRINIMCSSKETMIKNLSEMEELKSSKMNLQRQYTKFHKERKSHQDEVLKALQTVNEKASELADIKEHLLQEPSEILTRDSSSNCRSVRALTKPPSIPSFSGIDPPPRNECGFEQWYFQVSAYRSTHTEEAIRVGIISSVVGDASDYLVFVGLEAPVETILLRFQERYGKRSPTDKLQQEYFQLVQEKGERVQYFANRLEKVYRRLDCQVPGGFHRSSLKERLFFGMHRRLRDSMRFHFADSASTYESLLGASRNAEAEWFEDKPLRSHAAQIDDQLEEENEMIDNDVRKKQVCDDYSQEIAEGIKKLSLQIKALQTSGQFKHKKGGNGYKSKNKGHNKKSSSRDNTDKSNELVPGPCRKGNKPAQCYNCMGYGHLSGSCPTPENLDWGDLIRDESPPVKENPVPDPNTQ